MTAKSLTPELTSLIHHIELNESGWWKKAVNQTLRALMWTRREPATAPEIRNEFIKLGVDVPTETIERQFDALVTSGQFVKLPDGRFKLSEAAAREMQSQHDRAMGQQALCRDAFTASCGQHCPGLDANTLWETFSNELVSAIRLVGANTFHLLTGTHLERDSDWVSHFTKSHGKEHEDGLRRVASEFFNTENRAGREHILRLLSAHFFAEAAQLRPETLDAIEAGRKKRTIRIVLDTNFIFSVLGLHDNPANESALALLRLSGGATKYVDIRLYVLPGTIEEATRTITAHMLSVDRIRTTRALARAATDAPLSGMAQRFFRAAQESPGLTGEAFFRPYIDDLKTVLKRLGIEELDAHPASYSQRRDVVDDVTVMMNTLVKKEGPSTGASHMKLCYTTSFCGTSFMIGDVVRSILLSMWNFGAYPLIGD